MFNNKPSRSLALAIATLSPGVLSNLMINNWCNVGVSIIKAKNGQCERGPSGCINQGHAPWHLPPGNGQSLLDHPWDGASVSLKIGKDNVPEGVFQFEYTQSFDEWGGIWWNFSDIDGRGPGLAGTPFANDYIGATPTGNGSGQGTCVNIRCEPGRPCLDSYQHPDDHNTKWCPLDTGNMWLDLCMPPDMFYQSQLTVLDETLKKNMTDTKPPPSLERQRKSSSS